MAVWENNQLFTRLLNSLQFICKKTRKKRKKRRSVFLKYFPYIINRMFKMAVFVHYAPSKGFVYKKK